MLDMGSRLTRYGLVGPFYMTHQLPYAKKAISCLLETSNRHRPLGIATSRWHPVLTPGAEERHETPTGEHLSTRPRSLRHRRGHAASKAADCLRG
jgi:hypothetical protein